MAIKRFWCMYFQLFQLIRKANEIFHISIELTTPFSFRTSYVLRGTIEVAQLWVDILRKILQSIKKAFNQLWLSFKPNRNRRSWLSITLLMKARHRLITYIAPSNRNGRRTLYNLSYLLDRIVIWKYLYLHTLALFVTLKRR